MTLQKIYEFKFPYVMSRCVLWTPSQSQGLNKLIGIKLGGVKALQFILGRSSIPNSSDTLVLLSLSIPEIQWHSGLLPLEGLNRTQYQIQGLHSEGCNSDSWRQNLLLLVETWNIVKESCGWAVGCIFWWEKEEGERDEWVILRSRSGDNLVVSR